MVGREFIQNPGPTNIPDEVLEAFRRPPVDFDSDFFRALVDGIWDDLPGLFDADRVFCLTAVGHGAWESALVNLLAPGDEVLFAVGGLFGGRWGDMAEGLGYSVSRTGGSMRRAPDPALVHERLVADSGHRIKAVMVAQTETSTGTVTDIPGMRRAIDDAGHPALLVVDAIGSFGSEPMPLRGFGADVVLAASQKALMMPPGLSFCAVNERAFAIAESRPSPAWYWSWPERADLTTVYSRFGGTPPIQHMFALRAALDLIAEEGGIEAVATRHRRYASAVHACVEGWGKEGPIELNATEPSERAASVTLVRTGELDGDALRIMARERFHVSLGGGMLLGDRAFRIGHLGALNEPMLLGALGGVEMTMSVLGYPHGDGVSAAVAALASSV